MSLKKVLSWSELKRRLAQERKKGNSIVFTNGCFDLLHIGHLKIFESCKKMGDVLVVGVNSDSSARRIKGPERPVVSQGDRARLLSGLRAVDCVSLFSQDTPEKLIRLVRPDILVKGGDWKDNQIVGRGLAKKVVRVPLVKGKSTSNLINRIISRYGRTKR